MKRFTIALMTGLFFMACNQPTTDSVDDGVIETPRDGVFIHITHDHNDPHRVLMPLQMASVMASDKDVLIYLDIDAVNLVTRDAEDIAYEHFTPLKENLSNLIAMGVDIYACPSCMKIAGIEAEDLMEGVKVAEKERFFDFTAGNIISLTY